MIYLLRGFIKQVLVCAYFQYSHKCDRSTLEGEDSEGEGFAPATLRRGSVLDTIWLIYFIELKNSYIIHKYLHRNSQAFVLQNFKSGIY